jgi:Ni/Fe-hydrogenase subunit HybB-like protein
MERSDTTRSLIREKVFPGMNLREWVKEKIFLGMGLREYARSLITPFNIVAGMILLAGFPFIVLRFVHGLGAVTSASNVQPWGLFLSWGLFSGVPLSAAGFVLGTAVYLFGLKRYHPVVNNAILIGFLGYFFAVVFLLIDLGRPWRIYYPTIISFGPASVLFLVGWHVFLYLSCQFLEFCPTIFGWAGAERLRRGAKSLTIGLTIFGVILSTLHQSALGAMFLLMPEKVHPLWYSPYLPVFFLTSAIAAGICMVIVVSALVHRFFKGRRDPRWTERLNELTLGMGKAVAFTLFTYFGLKIIGIAHGNHWDLLGTSWGGWFLVELLAFVLFPCILLSIAVQRKDVALVRFGAFWTIVGVIINRLNVSLITFNWNLPHRELFEWKEFMIVITVVMIEILVYRWIIKRMPVIPEHPDYKVDY